MRTARCVGKVGAGFVRDVGEGWHGCMHARGERCEDGRVIGPEGQILAVKGSRGGCGAVTGK